MTAVEITPRELAHHLENGHPVQLVDVRQPWENALAKLPASVLVPLNDLPQRLPPRPLPRRRHRRLVVRGGPDRPALLR